MAEHARTLRGLRDLETVITTAVARSKSGYEFSANSYSFAAMDACLAMERALDDLRAALEAEFPSAAA